MFESLQNDRDALRALLKENEIEFVTPPQEESLQAQLATPSVESDMFGSPLKENVTECEASQIAALKEQLNEANVGHVKVNAMFQALVQERDALRDTLQEKETGHETQIAELEGKLEAANVGHVKVNAMFQALVNERDTLKAALKEKEN